jgi:O-antigen biosynthesis protein WbqV
VETLTALERVAHKTQVRERLCDVRDQARLNCVFEVDQPELVIHAAALKHVSFGERHPGECVLTNLIGTRNVLAALQTFGRGRFVLVSTDKAANPKNVMGACKRLAELHVSTADSRASGVQVVVVRFGNVFGSRGSVVPIFLDQIRRGAPITVTHPAMERYFMLFEEAVDLILHASTSEFLDDQWPVLVPDMGRPLSIVNLAQAMVKRCTPIAQTPSQILITYVNESEKLTEQLSDERELLLPTKVDGLSRVRPVSAPAPPTDAQLAELELLARTGADAKVRERVFSLLDQALNSEWGASARAISVS